MSVKERAVYALIFADERCYIGLSIDPVRRFKQHRRPSSGWDESFAPVVLQTVADNVWEANRLEFAWRWAAHLAGWKLYAKPGEFFDDLSLTTWDEVKEVGKQLMWRF